MAALTQRCPNLEGTYTMAGGARPPMSQTIFGSYVTGGNRRFPWETMTIAGQGDDSLVLTLARSQRQRDAFRDAVFARGAYYEREYRRMHSPSGRWSSGFATMTDSAYGANLETLYLAPVRSYTLRRRLSTTRAKAAGLRVDRVVHDPGPDRNNPRPDTVVGEVLLRKGWKGDLVAMAKVREAREFTVWCGDGLQGDPTRHVDRAHVGTLAVVRGGLGWPEPAPMGGAVRGATALARADRGFHPARSHRRCAAPDAPVRRTPADDRARWVPAIARRLPAIRPRPWRR
jgi:hypothetical protein